MNEDKGSGSERVSSSAAERVLQAAAEFDSVQDEMIDLQELRLAAQEAGISAEAFDRSVEQYRGTSAPAQRPVATSEARPSYLAVAGAGTLGASGAIALASLVLGMGPSDSAIAGAVFASLGSTSAVLAYFRAMARRKRPTNKADPDADRAKPLALGPDVSIAQPRPRPGHVADRGRLIPLPTS